MHYVEILYNELERLNPKHPGEDIAIGLHSYFTADHFPRTVVMGYDSPECVAGKLRKMMKATKKEALEQYEALKEYIEPLKNVVFRYGPAGFTAQMWSIHLAEKYIGHHNWRLYVDRERDYQAHAGECIKELSEQFSPDFLHDLSAKDPGLFSLLVEMGKIGNISKLDFLENIFRPVNAEYMKSMEENTRSYKQTVRNIRKELLK